MKRFGAVLCAAGTLLVAACGGGGGGGNPLPSGGANPTPTPVNTQTPTPPAANTVAQGTLVSDPADSPMPGVKVQLDPWSAYPTPGPTPTPIAVSTTDPQGHFTISAPNGTYLLVIGPDAVNTPPPGWSTPAPNATDTPIPGASTWLATVHDRIVLTGGGTAASPLPLVAPTMPPEPLYTPPAVETSGRYRLLTIDSLVQAPCILAWNALRESKSLAPAVVDEWSLENSYAVSWGAFQPNSVGQVFNVITTGNVSASGGANCANDLVGAAGSFSATQPWVLNPQTFWFGGAYFQGPSGAGVVEFPIDPRVNTDPNGLIWP